MYLTFVYNWRHPGFEHFLSDLAPRFFNWTGWMGVHQTGQQGKAFPGIGIPPFPQAD